MQTRTSRSCVGADYADEATALAVGKSHPVRGHKLETQIASLLFDTIFDCFAYVVAAVVVVMAVVGVVFIDTTKLRD